MKKSGNTSQDNSKSRGKVIEGEVIDKESIPASEAPADTKASAADAAAGKQSAAKSASASKQPSEKAEPAAQPASNAPTEPPSTEPAPTAAPKKPARWPGILALLLALLALLGVGYLYWLQLQTSQSLDNAQQQTSDAVTAALNENKQLINQQLGAVNQQMSSLKSQSSAEKTNISELQERLTRSIQQVTAQQQTSRKDWLLAEVEYLLRLANQRVLMEQTPQGALQLLRSADKILSETDDVSIYAVRKMLAADITALEAVPELDTEGVFLRLGALNGQVEQLKIIPLTEQHKLPDIVAEVSSGTLSDNLSADIQAAWAKVSSKFEQLIVIQHRDAPVEPLLSPQQNYYLQQNLHLMLEQAQLSLLQRKPRSYLSSLEKAEQWTGSYFEQSDAATQALLKALAELKSVEVAPQMPDISGSLTALKDYLQQIRRLKEGGAA